MFAKLLAFVVAGILSFLAVAFGAFNSIIPASHQEFHTPQLATTSQRVISNKEKVPSSATTTEQTVVSEKITELPPVVEKVATSSKKSMPGPLVAKKVVPPYQEIGLNKDEIIVLTNKERVSHGLSPLSENKRLDAIAEAKAVDMINKQYFEHVSPSGVDIGKLAESYGYAFTHVGENLALGDFASSSHVVNGWMNSPGHRANILGKDFTEIGVSALRGMWEGREVWWSVQEFGRPMPDCPTPSDATRKRIEIYESQLGKMRTSLEHLKAEIDGPGIAYDVYAQSVKDYNTIVDLYNKFLLEDKTLITAYNKEIEVYNQCIKDGM